MRNVFLLISFSLLFLLGVVLFGGSAWKYIGGADGLNIDGAAVTYTKQIRTGEGWNSYGGDTGGSRFSQAGAITPDNVRELKVAWKYRTGDVQKTDRLKNRSASQATPILAEGKLIFCTPYNEVIALNPGSGEELWRYNPEINLELEPANQFTCRGIAYWSDESADDASCRQRIFMGTNDARLISIDARIGVPCRTFGDNGEVNVNPGMDLVWPGEFQFTSPPVVLHDTVIIGSSISDNARVIAPKGVVRAYDARSGELKWVFDPIPREPDEGAQENWRGAWPPKEGHANVWAPMSVDAERGLVILPTSSASPDFYGGLRPGDNRHANSVVALEVETGTVRWGFQTVHHDVWDYDIPAQPGLYTVWRDGRFHDVVAQVTKTGHVFVLDRETGEPFLPVEERPTPQYSVEGEALSPTQPFPALTPAIVPNNVSPADAFGITWFDKNACRRIIENSRAEGLFTPPSVEGTILYPANSGGANWGGAAYDHTRNLLVVNMSNIAHLIKLIPETDVEEVSKIFHDSEVSPQTGAPYGIKRDVFLSPLGLPCTPPPWGVIAGVDLSTGDIVWRRRFGTTQDIAAGLALPFGTPNVGGPIITAGGLVFIGAAMDNYLRAFDVDTGEELWKGRLPAGGQATPMSYEWEGHQYVVIYAGGHARMGTTLGDSIVAFALPE